VDFAALTSSGVMAQGVFCGTFMHMQPHHHRISHTPMYFNELF